MNAQTESLPVLVPNKVSKLNLWARRHKNLYCAIGIISPMILGVLPGFGLQIILLVMHARHYELSPLRAVLLTIVACALMAFGVLFGALVGFLSLITEKYIYPENFPSNP